MIILIKIDYANIAEQKMEEKKSVQIFAHTDTHTLLYMREIFYAEIAQLTPHKSF